MGEEIRELHGMSCLSDQGKRASIKIREGEQTIFIDDTVCGGTNLTPSQARYLAAKLYRLSRRVKSRMEAKEATDGE